mgnify:CR=1 FL=1
MAGAGADAGGDARLAALSDFAPVVLAQALDFVARTPPLTSGEPVFDAAVPPPALVIEITESARIADLTDADLKEIGITALGDRKRILVGFDLGTNASCVLAGPADDFQRRELPRYMAAVPGVDRVRWASSEGGRR